ncbi:MAG: hypothetical protein ACRCWJ_23410 [Casimicrobium sp.]
MPDTIHINAYTSAPTTTPGFRGVFFRWTRAHTFGAIVAALTLLLALAFQITFLSAWHLPLGNPTIALDAKNASVTVAKDNASFEFAFVGPPAVSATQAINLRADAVLGISLNFSQIPEKTTLTLGWVGSRDRRKPSNLAINLPASTTPQSIYVPLRGHSEWRDTVTQFAVALVSRPGNPSVVLSKTEFVSATPSAAVSHAWDRWFAPASFIKLQNVAERVLPLSALFAFAALIAFAFVAWRKRDDGVARRDGLLGALMVLVVLCVALSAFSRDAFQINEAAATWLLAAAAITVALFAPGAPLPAMFTRAFGVEVLALALAAGSIALGGWPFAWVALAVLTALLAHRFPNAFSRVTPLVFFAPMIALGAFAQAAYAKHIDVAGTTLRDPSSLLANLIQQSSAIAAIVALLLLATFFLTRMQRSQRNDVAGIVLWLVLLGTIATFVVLPAQRVLDYSTGATWIVLPILVATIAWLLPSFLAPVTASAAIDTANNKTERDLSQVVRQLFDGAAASFETAINSERPASALAPLNRMREIAPASLITQAAELNYALRGVKLDQVRDAYIALKNAPANELSESMKNLVLAYANRTNDYDEVVVRASAQQPASEESSRLCARAQLLRAPLEDVEIARLAAIETLRACPKPNNLAHEIVELHLLNGEWEAAQAALAESSIVPQSVPGQVYVARLGFIATGGDKKYVEQINKLATWHGALGITQAAIGETLLATGNLAGARARFKLARDADLTLWAMERHMKDIDHALASASVAPAP